MALHRPSDQWRGVVGVFGWGWDVNGYLIGAIAVLVVQIGCVAVVSTIGDRLKYETHQALCGFGALLWFPCIALCIASSVVSQ